MPDHKLPDLAEAISAAIAACEWAHTATHHSGLPVVEREKIAHPIHTAAESLRAAERRASTITHSRDAAS
jgi:hypothetical protein